MDELDLELILRILKRDYVNFTNQGYPCTRIKKQIKILEKLLTKTK